MFDVSIVVAVINRRDIDFLLHEWLDIKALLKRPRFESHTPESIDAILTLAQDLAERELTGFSEERIATISAGQRPADLTREEAVAFDIASALVSGGVLPEPTYQQAVRLFGDDSTAELMYLIGFYCLVSVCLNGFDVPVPERNARY